MSSLVLVTGATGAAARSIIPALEAEGFAVRGIFNRSPGSSTSVDWRQMNFLQTLDFGQVLEGCVAVIHMAAELSDVSRMDRLNVETTKALLAAARAQNIRYVGLASSIVVYGSPRQRDVAESTPIIDPHRSLAAQYHAEPYMLEYARTKALMELFARDFADGNDLRIDLFRPSVIADRDRMLEASQWSTARKIGASWRCTQYIYGPDAGAAVVHLVKCGLSQSPRNARVEAYNICDETCGTFRDLLKVAFRLTGDKRYRLQWHIPWVLDALADLAKYRHLAIRYPLGALRLSSAKLRSTGFECPIGFDEAIRSSLLSKT